jgi:hypothetical protein
MHPKISTIEICGNPSYIRIVVDKDEEDNRKVGKVGSIVNQTLTPRPKHDRFYISY